MQDLFNFICLHWESILSILMFVVSVVIFIIKKKPVRSIDSFIQCLVNMNVRIAEKSDLKGAEKLNYCVNLVCEALKNVYPDLDTSKYIPFIKYCIEDVLDTPQKKEVK